MDFDAVIKRIKELEQELRETPYNKRTQHHVGLVKAKIARLKEKIEKRHEATKKEKKIGVKKTGDATVVIVGFPSVGKSTLLNKLTNAVSPTGEWDFTTLRCIPGLMEYKGAKIQLLDVPGIVKGAAMGIGRGKEVLAIMRAADLVLILVDVLHPGHLDIIKKEIFAAGIRLNQQKPDVKIKKTERGGIKIAETVDSKLTNRTIESMLKEFNIVNADVVVREDITADQLIDVIKGNRIYIPAVIVLNKIDCISQRKLEQLEKKIHPDICISAKDRINLKKLRELIFKSLSLIRIYLKEPNKKPDMNEPLIMPKNCSVRDICSKLHRDFISKFRFARVWGSSKFPGQKLGLDYALKDKDIVEIHL